MITREQAGALAEMTRAFRPAWDTRAIVSAIEEVRHRTPREVAWALIAIAQDLQFRTPKALTFEGDHWRAPTPTSKPNPYHPEPAVKFTEQGRAHIEAARLAAVEARARFLASATAATTEPTEEA